MLRHILLLLALTSSLVLGLRDLQWRWLSGSTISDGVGKCGQIGVYDQLYTPGARRYAALTSTDQGIFYLMGGWGWTTSTSDAGWMNDVWAHQQLSVDSRGSWAWIGGESAEADFIGNYGANPFPGGRYSHVVWRSGNNLVIHGGRGMGVAQGSGSTTYGLFADVWSFSPSDHTFSWLSGKSTLNYKASFASNDTHPGAVMEHAYLGGSLIFGGSGYDEQDEVFLADTWEFDGAKWIWRNGPKKGNAKSFGGVSGEFSSFFYPGGRQSIAVTSTNSSRVYLYGGNGMTTVNSGWLADLWAYDVQSNEYAYIHGESVEYDSKALPSIGEKFVFNASNAPGDLMEPAGWINSDANLLYIFGGFGYTAYLKSGFSNDFWVFDVVKGEWAWAGGSIERDQPNIVNDTQWFSSANVPGSRSGHRMSKNNELGLLYLFGGAKGGYCGDLWATKGPVNPDVGPSPTSVPTATASPSPIHTPTPTPSPMVFSTTDTIIVVCATSGTLLLVAAVMLGSRKGRAWMRGGPSDSDYLNLDDAGTIQHT